MSTLRNFQNEIEDIRHRELTKQRTQALSSAEKDKEPKKDKGKSKLEHQSRHVQSTNVGTDLDLQELEEQILVPWPFSQSGSSDVP